MQLTKFFIKEFYKTSEFDVDHLVADDFEYISHFGDILDFEKVLKMRRYLYNNAAIVHGEVRSENDRDFVVNIEVSTLEGVTVKGVKTITIQNNLLRKIKVRFLLDDDAINDFFAILYKDFNPND